MTTSIIIALVVMGVAVFLLSRVGFGIFALVSMMLGLSSVRQDFTYEGKTISMAMGRLKGLGRPDLPWKLVLIENRGKADQFNRLFNFDSMWLMIKSSYFAHANYGGFIDYVRGTNEHA